MKGRVLVYKKERTALQIEVSAPSDVGLNHAAIRKMTKYRDLKNEVEITWKLKCANIVPFESWSNVRIKREQEHCLYYC